MKKSIFGIILSLATILIFNACNKTKEVSFNMTPSSEAVIPASTAEGSYFEINSEVFETELDTNLELNKTTRELITEITTSSVVISRSSGFAFLDEAQVFLAKTNGDRVALTLDSAFTTTQQASVEIELSVIDDEEDISSFLKEDLLYYVVRLKTNEFSPNDRTLTVQASFSVEAEKD